MGKNSLIKATSKKKGRLKKSAEVDQKTKPLTTKSTKGKEVPKIKTPKKTKAATKTAAVSTDKITAAKKSAKHSPIRSSGDQLPVDMQRPDPIEKVMRSIAAGFVLLIIVVIGTSFSNMKKYYIKTADGAVEVRKGYFAPMGTELFLHLPEMQPPTSIKPAYDKNEVFPLIFHYYMERADSLLSVSRVPDFGKIKTYLGIALSYATTETLHNAAIRRLNNIDLMLLIYRAEVAAGKGTMAAFKNAKRYLDNAASLKLDQAQTKMVNLKIETISNLIAALEAKKSKRTKNPAKKK
ncbi:MAG: hypothetical protein V3S05_01550 [Desulfobacterales bacterium]